MYCKRCKEKKSSKLTDFARWNKILLKWKLEFLTVLKSSEIWFSPLSYWIERNPDLSHSIYFRRISSTVVKRYIKDLQKKEKKKEIDTQQYIASRYFSVSSHSEEHWSLYFKSHLSETKLGVALINRWLRSRGYSFLGEMHLLHILYYATFNLLTLLPGILFENIYYHKIIQFIYYWYNTCTCLRLPIGMLTDQANQSFGHSWPYVCDDRTFAKGFISLSNCGWS